MIVELQGCTVDLDRRLVHLGGGGTAKLTTMECKVLGHLWAQRGRDIGLDELLEQVWGFEGAVQSTAPYHTIRRLRKKLGPAGELIQTVHGVGYRLVSEDGPRSDHDAVPLPVSRRLPTGGAAIAVGHMSLDTRTRQLAGPDGEAVAVTALEARLLEYLHDARGQPVSKSELMQAIWGYGADADTRALTSVLGRVRRKLDERSRSLLVTRRGFGVALLAPQEAPELVGPDPMRPAYGREHLVEQVSRLVTGGSRLVTLTGMGGIGKTTLAVRVLNSDGIASQFRARTFVECAESRDLEDMVERWYRDGDIQAAGRGIDGLVEYYRTRKACVVVDNTEQVADAAASLFLQLCDGCPELRIVTTTRVPLGLPTEQVVQVPPVEPAAAVRILEHRLALEGASMAELPSHLDEFASMVDHMPLGLEILGSRLALLTGDMVKNGLADLVQWSSLDRDTPQRHRTLEHALEWSWNALSQQQRDLMKQLSAVGSVFDVHDAAAMASATAASLAELQRASFLERSDHRLRILVPVREFVRRRTEAAAVSASQHNAAHHYLTQVRQHAKLAISFEPGGSLRWLSDNSSAVENALAWSASSDARLAALASLEPFWNEVVSEAIVGRTLQQLGDDADRWQRHVLLVSWNMSTGRADNALAHLRDADGIGSAEQQRQWLHRLAFMARKMRDKTLVSEVAERVSSLDATKDDPHILWFLGLDRSQLATAEGQLKRARDLAVDQDDARLWLRVTESLVVNLFAQQRPAEALSVLRHSIGVAEHVDATASRVALLGQLCTAMLMLGRFAAARGAIEEAVEITDAWGDRDHAAENSRMRGLAALLAGAPEEAIKLLEQSRSLRVYGTQMAVVSSWSYTALASLMLGDVLSARHAVEQAAQGAHKVRSGVRALVAAIELVVSSRLGDPPPEWAVNALAGERMVRAVVDAHRMVDEGQTRENIVDILGTVGIDPLKRATWVGQRGPPVVLLAALETRLLE